CGFHPPQQSGIHQIPGLLRDSAVEADDVALLRQLLQRQVGDVVFFLLFRQAAVLGVVVQLAAEGDQPLRRGPRNVSKSYQAHLAGRELRDPLHHAPLFHLHLPSRPDGLVPLQGMAQEHQYQQDRLLRHGPGVAALVVADVNAPLPGGGEVNAVKRH
ncbi:30S ribosomal protein S7, partial [Dysosmobacter welbionis]